MATDRLFYKLATDHPAAILKRSHHHAAFKLAHHFDGHAGLAFQPIVMVMNQIELAELERLDKVDFKKD